MKRPVDPKDKVDYREIWKRLIDEHMTKTELMDRAEVPSNERTCIHNGDPISILYLLRFCKILHCELYELLGTVNQYRETRLTIMRKRNSLTVKQLSEMAGIQQDQLARFENRVDRIEEASVETVYKIAKALTCKIEDIIDL